MRCKLAAVPRGNGDGGAAGSRATLVESPESPESPEPSGSGLEEARLQRASRRAVCRDA